MSAARAASAALLEERLHHFGTEFVGNIRVRQQADGEMGFLLLHLVGALFDGVPANVVGTVGRLDLGCGVPDDGMIEAESDLVFRRGRETRLLQIGLRIRARWFAALI